MNKIDKNESAVVIIGSGAGGGTMAYELTKAGIPCVCLEAGSYIKPEDYTSDEWGAFMQMAWLDARGTSGSWRVNKDFPGPQRSKQSNTLREQTLTHSRTRPTIITLMSRP